MRSRWRCGHANKTTTPDWSTAPTGVRKVESTGPRNTSGVGGVDVRVRDRQRAVRVYRGQLPSPGPPTVAWRADRGSVLGGDQAGPEDRGCRRGIEVSSAVGTPVVSPRRRSEPEPHRVRVRPLSVVSRARGSSGCAALRGRRPRDGTPVGSVTVDDLASAAPEHVDAPVSVGPSGVDGPVASARRARRSKGEAGGQRSAAKAQHMSKSITSSATSRIPGAISMSSTATLCPEFR